MALLPEQTAKVPVIAGDEPDALLAAIQAAVYPDYYGQYRWMDVVDDCFVVDCPHTVCIDIWLLVSAMCNAGRFEVKVSKKTILQQY